MPTAKNNIPIITIDGPSGTGKGTICRMLGDYLQWNILDSGVLYRVIAFLAQTNNVPLDNLDQLCSLIRQLNLSFIRENDKELQIILFGNNVTELVRSDKCGRNASKIAAIAEVRHELIAMQREFVKLPGLVADGRDMGTVIFPQAKIKFYLDASLEERAKRRLLQLQAINTNVNFAEVISELNQRDARDMLRKHAPLIAADDAIHIDTTKFTIVQTFNYVLQLMSL